MNVLIINIRNNKVPGHTIACHIHNAIIGIVEIYDGHRVVVGRHVVAGS